MALLIFKIKHLILIVADCSFFSKSYLSQFGYVMDDKMKLQNGLFPASLTDPLDKLKKAIR
jgi:hypothetical protein